MTDLHQKKDSKSKHGVSPLVAGIAGAVAGGVAVATAAIVMSDKKNQKRVKDAMAGAKEKATDFIDNIKSQPLVKKSEQKLERVVEAVKK